MQHRNEVDPYGNEVQSAVSICKVTMMDKSTSLGMISSVGKRKSMNERQDRKILKGAWPKTCIGYGWGTFGKKGVQVEVEVQKGKSKSLFRDWMWLEGRATKKNLSIHKVRQEKYLLRNIEEVTSTASPEGRFRTLRRAKYTTTRAELVFCNSKVTDVTFWFEF